MYDAHTGQVIQTAQSQTPVSPKITPKISPSRIGGTPLSHGKVVDGITRRKASTINPPQKQTLTHAPISTQKPSLAQRLPQIHPPKQPTVLQKSHTLHRKAVHKPETTQKPYIHAISSSPKEPTEHADNSNNNIASHIPEQRLKRAFSATKSSVISKFGGANPHTTQVTHKLTVKPTPKVHQNNAPSIPPPAVHHFIKSHNNQPKKYVFEDQIKNANSHLLKPVKKPRTTHKFIRKLHLSPKVASITAGFIALVLLGSFFAYQKVPAISMRVAANQAGFMGTVPSKVPAGYAFAGPVQAVDNAVAVTYKSSSDNRQFVISQRQTNWSSEALLTNYLQDSKLNYQAYKENGLTIYVYDGSNATWVDKGIWYTVSGNQNSLSSSQLLEIAASS